MAFRANQEEAPTRCGVPYVVSNQPQASLAAPRDRAPVFVATALRVAGEDAAGVGQQLRELVSVVEERP
jgi:hypothetical protein